MFVPDLALPFSALLTAYALARIWWVAGIVLAVYLTKNVLFSPLVAKGWTKLSLIDKYLTQDDPKNPMTPVGLLVCDRISLDTVKQLYLERLIPRYPRLSCTIIKLQGENFYFRPDPDFSIDKHMTASKLLPLPGQEEVSEEQALQRLGEMYSDSSVLPQNGSPWAYECIENYQGGKTVLLWKFHHALSDGVGLLGLALQGIMDPPRDGEKLEDLMPKAVGHNNGRRSQKSALNSIAKHGGNLMKVVYSALSLPMVLLLKLLSRTDNNPFHGPLPEGRRLVGWLPPIDLEDIKLIKNKFNVTVNDVFMAVVARGFQKHWYAIGYKELVDCNAIIPVNMRTSGEMKNIKLENKLCLVGVDLPTSMSKSVGDVITKVNQRMENLKKSPEPLAMYFALLIAASILPLSWVTALQQLLTNKSTVLLSNVPGPVKPIFFGGRKVHDLFAWPPASGAVIAGGCMSSYDGKVRLGVTLDAAVCKELHPVVKAIQAAFIELLDEAKQR